MLLFLLLHYTSVNYSTIQMYHPATLAPSYFPLHPLQSVVPIITLYLYIILVNAKHQSSKKPSRSSKPHKASILGLFVIPFMYFMYFNFSNFNPFHHSTNTRYLLQAFHYATFQPLQYYTSVVPITTLYIFPLYICIPYSHRSTIIYYTTPLYNSLLFQLYTFQLYKPLLFTIYSYRSITLQSLIVFNTCFIVNTRLFSKILHVFQFPKYPPFPLSQNATLYYYFFPNASTTYLLQ